MPIAIGIVVCGTGVGTMVFAGLGHFLLNVTTWQISFLVEAALAASMGIAALAFKPLKPIKVQLASSTPVQTTSKMKSEPEPFRERRDSVFVKTNTRRDTSILSMKTAHSLVWNTFAQEVTMMAVDRHKKNLCRSNCCSCSKRKVKNENVLILREAKRAHGDRRASYVEEVRFSEIYGTVEHCFILFSIKCIFINFTCVHISFCLIVV